MTCQVTGANHVTVKTPELLHLRIDESQHEVGLSEIKLARAVGTTK